jgi:hypothetical protein
VAMRESRPSNRARWCARAAGRSRAR